MSGIDVASQEARTPLPGGRVPLIPGDGIGKNGQDSRAKSRARLPVRCSCWPPARSPGSSARPAASPPWVSYPALLLAGVAPVQANVANLVALVTCWPGSAAASQPELRGRGPWLRRWGIVAALGGAAGSLLLLVTPPGVFSRVVPFLVAAGWPCCASRGWRRGRRGGLERAGAGCCCRAASRLLSCYNGYFGAGSGVLLLALLLLTTDPRLPTANALKNMVVGAATITSAVLFAMLHPGGLGRRRATGARPVRRQPGRTLGRQAASAARAALARRAERPGAGAPAVVQPGWLSAGLSAKHKRAEPPPRRP